MTVVTAASDGGRSSVSAPSNRMPSGLGRAQRVVAVTVWLPELLLASAGSLQRLDAAGVPIDLLELAWLDSATDRRALSALASLKLRGLSRHRLGLPTPFGVERAPDLVAAISELIGFDPEPGVVCLVPSRADERGHGAGAIARAAHQALNAAVVLIAGAYRVRTVSFAPPLGARTAEVELDAFQWRRKCQSLAACAPDVAPLSGHREYLSG